MLHHEPQPDLGARHPSVASPPPSGTLPALIDPGSIFRSPTEVAEHPELSQSEKRLVLLSWARDELVLEHVARRMSPDLGVRSRIDAVADALDPLDPAAASTYRAAARELRGPGKPRPRPKRLH